MSIKNYFIPTVLILSILFSCEKPAQIDYERERAEIEKAVNNTIGWALTKDKDLSYSVVAQDENLFILNPGESSVVGFDAFKDMTENFFMSDAFKAVSFEVRGLKINISESGTAAWFSCRLDDFCEINGKPDGWENVRWTGVLEKRQGKWVHVQMHFSYSVEQIKEQK